MKKNPFQYLKTHGRAGVCFLAAALFLSAQVVSAASHKATTIRLVKTEGEVTIENSEKGELIQTEEMRLYSGDHEITGEASYAWMNLDDAKALKLDELSESELRKKGRKLEVLLDSGSIFFNVTVPLEDDETLNIRSSTMVTGIRGTCGWVRILDGETTRVYLLEGELECIVTNPVEGGTKSITLKPGQYADFKVYDLDREGDSCDILMEQFQKEDIEPYVLIELVGDTPLIQEIYEQSGIDLRELTAEEVRGALEKVQAENARRQQEILRAAGEQNAVISKDPVWVFDTPAEVAAEEEPQLTAADIPTLPTREEPQRVTVAQNQETSAPAAQTPASAPTDTPANTPTTENTDTAQETPAEEDSIIYLTMPQTATTVQGYLDRPKVKQVVLQPGSGSADDNALKVDIAFTAPENKTLVAQAGVPVSVDPGRSFTVNGTADLRDTFTNNGTVTVNSANTLRVAKRFVNNGALENTATGRIVLTEGLISSGTLTTSGLIEAATDASGETLITISGGAFTITGGKITSDQFETIVEIQSDASVTLTLSGGSISNDKEGGATLNVSTGDFRIDALGTDIMGITDTLLGTETDLGQYGAASVWLKDERYHLVALSSVDSYPVVVSGNIEHGTIDVPGRVEVGATVPLTITPDAGYELDTLTVNLYNEDGSTGTAVAVSADYNFTMPRGNVIVGGSFRKILVSHQVSADNAAGGAVQADVTEAKEGDIVTLIVTPDIGYEVERVTVTDADGNAVEVTESDTGYTFIMPDGAVTTAATFRIKTYTVTWKDEDGTVLETDAGVEYGSTPKFGGTEPARAADAQYTYIFAWSPAITEVTGDVTYTASYSRTLNQYMVKFVDESGKELSAKAYDYGTAADGIETPEAPAKMGDAQYTYSFAGWTKTDDETDTAVYTSATLPTVMEAVTYTATYDSTVNTYTVTWTDEDGTVLETDTNVAYGTTPSFDGTEPAKTGNAQYTYSFAGWTKAEDETDTTVYTNATLPTVTGAVTYTAIYDSTVNTYTVTWTDEDGTVLETDANVAYGTTPKFDGATPAKTGNAQYTYSFAGWTKAEDETDTTVYTSAALPTVTGAVTYTAAYTETINKYTITWQNDDGSTMDTVQMEYGAIPNHEAAVKANTPQYTYAFTGWEAGGVYYKIGEALPEVTGDATYQAVYDSTVNTYTITWLNADGKELQKDEKVPYGATPSYAGATPDKATDDDYIYTFNGWTDGTADYVTGGTPIPNVTDNVTYTAIYTTTPVVKVSKVSLDLTDINIDLGGTSLTQTITAAITPTDATNQSVVWRVTDGTDVISLEADGLKAMVTALKEGTAIVSATSEDGNHTASCTVTVATAVTGVSLDREDGALTVPLGTTGSLTATVAPDAATNKNMTWSSSDEKVVTVAPGETVGTAVVTPVAIGTAVITVTTADGGKTAECTVTVPGITLDLDTLELPLVTEETTNTKQLTATVVPEPAEDAALTWTSSDTSVATVDGNGLTATVTPQGVGTVTITVETADGYRAACTVTVPAVAVTGVSLDKTELELTLPSAVGIIDDGTDPDTGDIGGDLTPIFPGGDISLDDEQMQTAILMATLEPADATNTNVEWTSSNEAVATVEPDENDGRMAFVTPKGAGEAIITVKTEDGNLTASCTVTVTKGTKPVTGVSLMDGETESYVYNTIELPEPVADDTGAVEVTTGTLIAGIWPEDATNQKVTWKSSNPAAVTVEPDADDGRIAIITPVATGTATITVTTVSGGRTASCEVRVTKCVTGVMLDKASVELTVGETETESLTASILPVDATNQNVTWSSSNPNVASVEADDENGLTATVTAMTAGTATITVTTEDGEYTDSCAVTVTKPAAAVTTLVDGSTFNDLMKQAANNQLNAVKAFKHAAEIPSGAKLQKISAEDAAIKAYLWFDGTDGTVYWYSDADTVYLNADAGAVSGKDYGMFSNCQYMTSVDLSGFDTSRVTNMSYLFSMCRGLNALDLSGFDTSNVENMRYMFYYCYNLPELDVSMLDTSKATNMHAMFYYCYMLTALDLSGFQTANVTDMGTMFMECRRLTSLNLTGFDTANVTDMSMMFCGCYNLPIEGLVGLDGFNTSKVTTMLSMFDECNALTTLNISNFDTSNVTDMKQMFQECQKLQTLVLGEGFSTGNVTNMYRMFYKCRALQTLDLSGRDLSGVTNMQEIFYNCEALTSLNLSNCKAQNVKSLRSAFDNCNALEILNLTGFTTSEALTDMYCTFYKCEKVQELDLSGFHTAQVTSMRSTFAECALLETIYANKGFSTSQVSNSDLIFNQCTNLKGGNGTAYNGSSLNYAQVDSADTPGYFTYKAAPEP